MFFWKPSLALMDWSAVSSSQRSPYPGPLLFLTLTYQPDQSDCEKQQVPHAACSLNAHSSPFAYLIKHDKKDLCCWSHDNGLDDAGQWDRQHFCGSKLWQHFFLFNHWGWGLQFSLTAKGETRAGYPSVSLSHSGCLQYTDVYWMRSWPYNVKRCKTTK